MTARKRGYDVSDGIGPNLKAQRADLFPFDTPYPLSRLSAPSPHGGGRVFASLSNRV